MLLTKDNVKEFTKVFLEGQRERNRKLREVLPDRVSVRSTLEEEPIAVKYNRELFEKKQKEQKALLKKTPKSLRDFITDNSLRYEKLNPYQHRISNPKNGKFVDWWDGKKQTMRNIKGEFEWQGKNKMALLHELAKLI